MTGQNVYSGTTECCGVVFPFVLSYTLIVSVPETFYSMHCLLSFTIAELRLVRLYVTSIAGSLSLLHTWTPVAAMRLPGTFCDLVATCG